jgi:hypothetical protein
MALLAVVVIPLVDVRQFVGQDTGRQLTPVWPVVYFPEEKHRFPFIRGFGQVRKRPLGGGLEWSSEGAFCDVSHALRFSRRFLAERPALRTGSLRAYCAFRRLYWDGRFKAGSPDVDPASIIGRVEVGFVVRRIDELPLDLTHGVLGEIVTSILTHECYLLSKRAPETGRPPERFGLLFAGQRLAAAYLRATTKTKALEMAEANRWWVGTGSPIVLLKADGAREVEIPPGCLEVRDPELERHDIDVFLHRHPAEGLMRPVWIVRHEHATPDVLRRLRINISRVHSEIAGLRWVTQVVNKGQLKPAPRSTADEAFQEYLSNALPYLARDSFNGLPNFELLQAALSVLDTPTPHDLRALREVVEHIRPATRGQITQLGNRLEAVQEWDFFIAHAGPDKPQAEELYSRLAPTARTFLDSKSLMPGDNWFRQISRAHRASLITIVLVSSNTEHAYFQGEEIVVAVQMLRDNPETHRVIPVYLNDAPGTPVLDYGLRSQHALFLTPQSDLDDVAKSLLATLATLRQRRRADPAAA